MSWISRLFETYENCITNETSQPWPISHFVKNAHIEVVIDGSGNYKSGRLKLLNGDDSSTLIPATESSAGRAGAKIAPHPLCEELGYCAGDLPDIKSEKFTAFMAQLLEWNRSDFNHSKVDAIYKYLKRETLWRDLCQEIEFPITFKNKSGQATKLLPEKTFIRWRVEVEGEPCNATWEDKSLIDNWIAFDQFFNATNGFCFVKGVEARSSSNHPRFIRNSGDGAKLISSNDENGFTFRGKFFDAGQSAEVSFEVTQKAHNALRWLIARQGFRNGDQAIVAWAVSGKSVPEPMQDSYTLIDWDDLDEVSSTEEPLVNIDHSRDIGQSFAIKLNKKMAGYRAELGDTENIVIMAIDSATPGRMGITYYRECFAKEFIERLEQWHLDFSWPQRHIIDVPQQSGKKPKSKTIWPVSTPAPYMIAEAGYGKTITDSLKKNLYERLMPCILEGRPLPIDILNMCISHAKNPNGSEHWEWERNLGVACALYRGFFNRHPDHNKRRNYAMSLETENTSRDYLYGRLLAIAERIEEIALSVAGEGRSTTAARLMQRFAARPYSTWLNLELALQPYMQRLQNSRMGFLVNRKKELDDILNMFTPEDFINDKSLSGEFLLAYHCQRQALRNKTETEIEPDHV